MPWHLSVSPTTRVQQSLIKLVMRSLQHVQGLLILGHLKSRKNPRRGVGSVQGTALGLQSVLSGIENPMAH